MPSRKRGQGKARRAKAHCNSSEANDGGGTPIRTKGRPLAQNQPTLNELMSNLSMANAPAPETLVRLRERNRPLLEYLRKRVVATEKSEGGGCLHGRLAPPDIYCTGIAPHVKEFLGEAFETALRHAHAPIIVPMAGAYRRLRDAEPVVENLLQRNRLLPTLQSDEGKRSWFLSLLTSLGTNCILEGYGKGYDTDVVVGTAVFLAMCSQRLVYKDQSPEMSEMMTDLIDHPEHETHRFFSKSAPCKCLRKSYKFLKKAKPIMWQCANCDQWKKRSELQQCSRCGVTYYCGKSCQSSHWAVHKRFCNECRDNVEMHSR